MKLYAPSTIKEIKDRYGFRLSKSLGQNFLTDKNIIDKIIAATEITDEDLVIEIDLESEFSPMKLPKGLNRLRQ